MWKRTLVTFCLGLLALCPVNGQSTTPTTTTSASVVPTVEEKGLIVTTYDDYGWSSNPAQVRHFLNYPGIDSDTGVDSKRLSFTNSDIHLLSIDNDFRKKLVYMYDFHFSIIVIGSNYSASMNTTDMNFKVMHHVMSRGTVQIAYDWLSNTLYWCDSAVNKIFAASGDWDKVDDDHYKIIASGLDAPDGITIDPIEGYLFWSENGAVPKLERARPDGSDATTFTNVSLKSPMSLEADPKTKRLYWIDTWYESVESCTYDGNSLGYHPRLTHSFLFDLGIFKDTLYVTDISEEMMYVLDKNTLRKKADSVHLIDQFETIYGISVYNEEAQPLKTTDYCGNKNCEHMCVSMKYGAKCLCGEGYKLNDDERSCTEDTGAFDKAFVYANASHICFNDIRSIVSTGYFDVKCVFTMIKKPNRTTPVPVNPTRTNPPTNAPTTARRPTTQSTPAQDVNTTTNNPRTTVTKPSTRAPTTTLPPPTVAPDDAIRMIELDMKDRIVFFVTKNDRLFKRSLRENIDSDVKTELAQGSAITGLAFDPEDRNLYWCQSAGDIYVVDVDNNDVSPITENGNKPSEPSDLIVLIDQRKLAFISDGNTIMTRDLNTGATKTIAKGIENMSSLIFNRDKRLFYFLALGKGRIYSVPLDGEEEPVIVTSLPDVQTYLLLEYHEVYIWVYAADTYPNIVMTADKERPYVSTGHNKFDNVSTIVDMKILDLERQVAGPGFCSFDNGGCAHMCLTVNDAGRPSKVCKCKKGYTLGADGKNCTSIPFKDHFVLVLDWTNDEIVQLKLDTFELRAIPARETYFYSAIYIDPDTARIYWSALYDSYIYSSELDGTDTKIESDLGYSYPHKYVKDTSTGNLYYISYYDQYVGLITPNGENVVLIKDFFFEDLTAIEVHPGTGYVYYAVIDYGEAYIARAHMDGTNVTKLIEGAHVKEPEGLAIDYINSKLYYSDMSEDTIIQCNLDGKECLTIVNTTETQITEIVTDGTHIYYAAYRRDYIVRVDLTPPYNAKILGQNSGFGKVNSIAYYSTENRNKQPVNNKCQPNGGLADCSTICIPTPKGRTCACEQGVNLHSDGRTCTNVHLCSDIITQRNPLTNELIEITFPSTCLRRLDSNCQYRCPPNYRPIDNRKNLTCLVDGWDRETHQLCEEVRCPASIPNGDVKPDCSRNIGSACGYTCKKGYKESQSEILCRDTGKWHGKDSEYCKTFMCNGTIPNGRIDPACSLVIGTKCSFTCEKFYDISTQTKLNQITCGYDGWNVDVSKICTEAQCKSLQNGKVNAGCINGVGRSCSYSCNQGFANSTEEVVCKFDHSWHPNVACKSVQCPMNIDKGMVVSECTRQIDSVCSYNCDDPYSPFNHHGKVRCLTTGKWNQTKDLCIEPMKITPEAQTQKTSPGVIVGMVVLAVIIVILIVLAVFLFRRKQTQSTYATASYKNGSNIAIENPGYHETNMTNIEVKDDHPYSSVDPNQMQPAHFVEDRGDGQVNPMYGVEPLPEVAHVDVNQDKTVLTYDSWLKEQKQKH
ncbi:hypothetical protein ACF0H5_005941 [Mactra antiquata]